MKPTIEKGIPIPSKIASQGQEISSVMSQLQIGDSFFMLRKLNNIQYYKIKFRMNFTQRKVEGGYRIWRTK